MIRKLLVAAGELLVTAGLLMVLFVVWEFGWVGLTEGAAQDARAGTVARDFAADALRPGASGHLAVSKLGYGQVFAVLRIPRLSAGWAKPVAEGVGLDVLAEGIGHYPGTPLPGQVGNSAFAGHRSGAGNPLIDIDAIQAGDAIVVETREGWYVYRAQSHEIVEATQTEVVAPVPDRPGVAPTQPWLTLTSCHPRWGSAKRYIVHALFDRFAPRADGEPAELAGAR